MRRLLGRVLFGGGRLERALKLIAPLPLVVWLSYSNPLEFFVPYLFTVLYLIFSTLLPTTPGGVGIVFSLGLLLVVLESLWVCAAFKILVLQKAAGHAKWQMDLVQVVLYTVVLIFVVGARLSTYNQLLSIGLFVCVQMIPLVYSPLYRSVRDGFSMSLRATELQLILNHFNIILIALRLAGFGWMVPYLKAASSVLLTSCPNVVVIDATTGHATINEGTCEITHIPDIPKRLELFTKEPLQVIGHPGVSLELRYEFIHSIVPLLLRGWKPLGLVLPVLGFGPVIVGAGLIATLLPRPRYARSIARSCVVQLSRSVKNHIVAITDTQIGGPPVAYEEYGIVPFEKGEPLLNDRRFGTPEKRPGDGVVAEHPGFRRRVKEAMSFKRRRWGDYGMKSVVLRSKEVESITMLGRMEQWALNPLGVSNMGGLAGVAGRLRRAAATLALLNEVECSGISPEQLRSQMVLAAQTYQMVELAVALKMGTHKSDADRQIQEDWIRRLTFQINRLHELRARLREQAIEGVRDSEETLMAIRWVTSDRLMRVMVDDPIEVCQATLKLLTQQKTRKLRFFATNIGTFLAPCCAFLGICVFCWYKALTRLARRWRRNRESMPQDLVDLWTTEILPSGSDDLLMVEGRAVVLPKEVTTRERRLRFSQLDRLWSGLKFIVPLAGLFALMIFVDSWATLSLTDEARDFKASLADPLASLAPGLLAPGLVKIDFHYFRYSKVPPWAMLGFLTTYILTLEGTLKRILLRLAGMLMGCLSGWLCIYWFPGNRPVVHGAWIMVGCFVAVFLSVNPRAPHLGFHPQWGYAFQFFCYQQAIIIVEVATESLLLRDELTASRLVGQCIGIGLAIVASLCPPNFANKAIRTHLANGVRSLYYTLRTTTQLVHGLDTKAIDLYSSWQDEHARRMADLDFDLNEVSKLRADNNLLDLLPHLRTSQPLHDIYAALRRLVVLRESTLILAKGTSPTSICSGEEVVRIDFDESFEDSFRKTDVAISPRSPQLLTEGVHQAILQAIRHESPVPAGSLATDQPLLIEKLTSQHRPIAVGSPDPVTRERRLRQSTIQLQSLPRTSPEVFSPGHIPTPASLSRISSRRSRHTDDGEETEQLKPIAPPARRPPSDFSSSESYVQLRSHVDRAVHIEARSPAVSPLAAKRRQLVESNSSASDKFQLIGRPTAIASPRYRLVSDKTESFVSATPSATPPAPAFVPMRSRPVPVPEPESAPVPSLEDRLAEALRERDEAKQRLAEQEREVMVSREEQDRLRSQLEQAEQELQRVRTEQASAATLPEEEAEQEGSDDWFNSVRSSESESRSGPHVRDVEVDLGEIKAQWKSRNYAEIVQGVMYDMEKVYRLMEFGVESAGRRRGRKLGEAQWNELALTSLENVRQKSEQITRAGVRDLQQLHMHGIGCGAMERALLWSAMIYAEVAELEGLRAMIEQLWR